MKLNQWSVVSIATLLLSSQVMAQQSDGSCNGFSFPMAGDGQNISTSWPLRVLRDDAPVYSDASGSRITTQLKFADVLDAVRISDSPERGRVLVSKSGSLPGESLGWMDRQELLCTIGPLKNDNKLDRKAFIKTPPEPEIQDRVKTSSVPAYPCYQGGCQKNMSLSRFQMYFIVAEKSARYLLSEQYNLVLGPPLIGWIDKDKIIPWNTTLQLRPAEEVTRNIIGYPDLSTAARGAGSSQRGVILTGGNIWYKFPLHAPLLDKQTERGREYYHVAAPGIGMSGFDVEKMDQQTAAVEKLKQADVFFLLDGTRSMQPSLDAAKRFARELVQQLSSHEHRETHYRFGFRIYRDDFRGSRWSGDQSLGESLPLSGTCEARAEITTTIKEQFERKIRLVKESDEKPTEDPSYQENLFIGLKQAVKDMANCPERIKILFVIADHGDNQEQVPSRVVTDLTQIFPHSVRLFFIQTPNQKSFDSAYQNAYQRFQRQARTILSRVYPRLNADNNLLTLSSGTKDRIIEQLTKQVTQQVGDHTRSDIANETIQKIRAGQSIQSIVEQGMKDGDLPVLYWQLFEKDFCQKFGDQCQHSVDHRVIDAYIPISDDLIEEIWMDARDMENWKSLLRPLFQNIQGKSFDQQKREFTRLLKEELQRILGEPMIQGATLAEIVDRKGGLPVREHSPLMQYTVTEIRQMEKCEFTRLTKWVENIYRVLNNVTGSPTVKVSYSLTDFPKSQCPHVSPKGQNIQRLMLDQSAQPLGPDDNHSYLHDFRKGQTIYSIPKDFLP